MPVTIPAGTKFEGISPTTDVNKRSALINANQEVFTIEDIAQTVGGGGFTITNNYIPKGNASGSIVNSSLYEFIDPLNNKTLAGNYNNGINLTGTSAQNFVNILTVDPIARFSFVGDVLGSYGAAFGLLVNDDPSFAYAQILLNGNAVLNFTPAMAAYSFGGATSKFGIINADTASSSLSVTLDLVDNVGGTDYIRVDVGGTPYKIALVP